MTKTFYERQELAKAFGSEVDRMQRCLHNAGYTLKIDSIVRA